MTHRLWCLVGEQPANQRPRTGAEACGGLAREEAKPPRQDASGRPKPVQFAVITAYSSVRPRRHKGNRRVEEAWSRAPTVNTRTVNIQFSFSFRIAPSVEITPFAPCGQMVTCLRSRMCPREDYTCVRAFRPVHRAPRAVCVSHVPRPGLCELEE